jgi:hypothetical protein
MSRSIRPGCKHGSNTAQRQLEQIQLADSLDRLNLLLEKTMKVLARAEDNDDLKLMLQAVREAERLTKMIHALSPEPDAASLFLETTDPGWPETGTTPGIQQWAREKVRTSIKTSLRTPCAGSHLEAELPPEQLSPPVKPIPMVRKDQASRHPQVPVIPSTVPQPVTALRSITDLGTATTLETALAPPDSPTAKKNNHAGPN